MLPLQTIADWQNAYIGGADPVDLLIERRAQLGGRALPVYLHLIAAEQLASRLEALRRIETRFDSRRALLAAQPLWGVPFVVKDNIDIAGAPTTAACPAFAFVAEKNANVVQRLLDAGAVWLAKTNLDQFATGLVGTRSPYGAPASVFSPDHVSGGSSSGSAVAVACGDVPFALGTDTAGSGRVPAAFNHIVGLKPTPGRVGTGGMLPACRSLDCPSIFALTVDDAAGVLAIVEGADTGDAFSRFEPGPAELPAPLRIGFPHPLPPQVDEAHAAGFEAAAARLRATHTLLPVDFSPLYEVAALLYQGPWVAERHLVVRELLALDPGALDPAVRQVIAAAERFTADDAFAGRYALQALARDAARIWEQCDLLLVPTTTRHPRFSEVAADPIGVNSALGVFTNFVNLLGWSALALPASLSPAGLPFGITLIGRAGHDAALAAFGRRWQAASNEPLGATDRRFGETVPARLPAPATQPVLPVAVVGAHLSGLPLNHQLIELGAHRLETTRTAPRYRLIALPDSRPRKPGLIRVGNGDRGDAIEVEVWALPVDAVGRLLAGIASPLGLGNVELADGRHVHGFVCEGFAAEAAEDISRFGGWRAYLASF